MDSLIGKQKTRTQIGMHTVETVLMGFKQEQEFHWELD